MRQYFSNQPSQKKIRQFLKMLDVMKGPEPQISRSRKQNIEGTMQKHVKSN